MIKFKDSEILFANGQAEISLKCWDEFPAFVRENDNLKGYIFRGLSRSSFDLSPTLIRVLNERWKPGGEVVPIGNALISTIKQQLQRFRLAIRGRISLSDREAASESEVWAIGQHHGLKTPLLDWTASPFVAAFFAFSETREIALKESLDEERLREELKKFKEKSDEARTVFAFFARRMNEVFYEWVNKELAGIDEKLPAKLAKMESFADDVDRGAGLGLVERIAERLFPADPDIYCKCREALDATELNVPRVISPLSSENRRLISQRGLFTKHFDPLENLVAGLFNEGHEPGKYATNEPILLKINIPNAERDTALKWLDAANINYLSLFPDLHGAAQFSNSRI